jgi:hypothetical protein
MEGTDAITPGVIDLGNKSVAPEGGLPFLLDCPSFSERGVALNATWSLARTHIRQPSVDSVEEFAIQTSNQVHGL